MNNYQKSNLQKLLISIIIPTLNEEKGISYVIDEIKNNLHNYNYEIIVVDGNSTDNTKTIAINKGAFVINEIRKGYGRAIKTGILNCNGDIIVILDGDGTYPAYDIPKMISLLLKKNIDFITTNRMSYLKPESMSISHKMGNNILNLFFNILFSYNIMDSQSGMWIFKKDIIKDILPTSDGMSFSQEIKINAIKKYSLIEIPIIYRERIGEVKLRTFYDGFMNLLNLFILKIKK